jgi:transmembrane 9 superfamily protein 2/4
MMMSVLVLYVLFGCAGGYGSSRLYKSFRGKAWQRCTIFTAVLFPGLCMAQFLLLNTICAFYHSTLSVPFLVVLTIFALWCLVSIPLVFFGAYFGYKKDIMKYPTVTSTIPREIPQGEWYFSIPVMMLCGGLLPFGAAFVEFFFIMSSIWMDQYYYVFGFTLLVFIILMVTCALLSMLVTYLLLCSEDYNWHWRSFLVTGSSAFYVFAYSVVWFQTLDPSSMLITYMIYFGYMFLISSAIFLITGTAGFLSCLWFTKKMFGSIKVD